MGIGLFSTVNSKLIGFDDMKSSALLSITIQVLRSILSQLLIIIGFSVFGAVIGYVVSYMLATMLGTFIIYSNHYRKLSSKAESEGFKANLRTMIGYGLPLYLSSLTQNIIGVYRGMILAWFATNFMVGNFTIALNFDFATLILLLTGPITTALFPAFSKLNPLGEEMRRMVKYAVKYTATLIIPASAFVIVMAKDLVSIIYGSSYTLAPELLSVYCIAFLYAGLGSVMWGSFFNGISETKVNLKSTLIYATFFIPLAFLLAQSYNVLGLMLAMLLSSLASLIYILQIATRKFNLSIDKESALKIYIASAVSAMPVPPLAYLSPLPSLINLIIGATCYASIYLTIMPIIGGLPGRH